jgi:hypothetical protein
MTQTERKQRSEKSAVIVARLVRAQLRAMGCQRFDLGIKRDAGEMILREGQGPIEIEEAIKWLRHENAKGAHIYIRAAGSHNLTLIDDLAIEAVERMKGEGFEPAVVVETSPNNFQAWLKHGQVLDAAMSTRLAKQLAERFDGDLSSADWRHFGRLAGFTNTKRERNYRRECGHLCGCGQLPGMFTRRRPSSLPASEQAAMAQRGRARSRVSNRAGAGGNARESGHWASFTQILHMPVIFIALIWRGPSTPPGAVGRWNRSRMNCSMGAILVRKEAASGSSNTPSAPPAKR